MIKYEVGEQFPESNKANGIETCLCRFNNSFFDILYYINAPDETEISTWKKGKTRYGVYVNSEIPFFIVDFKGKNWNFDVSLNILKVADEMQDAWLNSPGNIVNLYLIDTRTNTLLGIRTISIHTAITERIRDTLEIQSGKYDDAFAVEAQINRIMDGISTSEMIARIRMIDLS